MDIMSRFSTNGGDSSSDTDVDDILELFGETDNQNEMENPQESKEKEESVKRVKNNGGDKLPLTNNIVEGSAVFNQRVQAKPSSDKLMGPVIYGFKLKNLRIGTQELEERVGQKKQHSISQLANASRIEIESFNKGVLRSWCFHGVITAKSEARVSKKNSNYLIWSIGDLERREKSSVKVMVFGEAYQKFWKENQGSFVVVFCPDILEKRKDTENLTVSVKETWQVAIVGFSLDYGLCQATRKDGRPCTVAINKSKAKFCEFHVMSEMAKLKKATAASTAAAKSSREPLGIRGQLKNQMGLIGSTAKVMGKAYGSYSAERVKVESSSANSKKTGASTFGIFRQNNAQGLAYSRSMNGGNKPSNFTKTNQGMKNPAQTSLLSSGNKSSGNQTALSQSYHSLKLEQVNRFVHPKNFVGSHPSAGQGLHQNKILNASKGKKRPLPTTLISSKLPTRGSMIQNFTLGQRKAGNQGLWENHKRIKHASGQVLSTLGKRSGPNKILNPPNKESACFDKVQVSKTPQLQQQDSPAEQVKQARDNNTRKDVLNEILKNKRKAQKNSSENQQRAMKHLLDKRAKNGEAAKVMPALKKEREVMVPKQSSVFGKVLHRGGQVQEVQMQKWRQFNGIGEVDEDQVRAQQLQAAMKMKDVELLKAAPGNLKTMKSQQQPLLISRNRSSIASKGCSLFAKAMDMSSADMQELLKKKSKYAEDANEKMDEDMQKRMGVLEDKENIAEKAKEVQKIKVKALYCKQCNRTMEHGHVNPFCKQNSHPLVERMSWKRFFSCTKCQNRACIVEGRLPSRACSKCGSDSWIKCSIFKEKQQTSDLRPTLVTAMAEQSRITDYISLNATI